MFDTFPQKNEYLNICFKRVNPPNYIVCFIFEAQGTVKVNKSCVDGLLETLTAGKFLAWSSAWHAQDTGHVFIRVAGAIFRARC